jgi:hypothetical protein
MEVTAKTRYSFLLLSSFIFCYFLPNIIIANEIFSGGSGESKCFTISTKYDLTPNNNYEVNGFIKLSNSSILYLKELTPNNTKSLSAIIFDRLNDSIYFFSYSLSVEKPYDSISFDLCTDILAGNDTICDIIFRDIFINQQSIEIDTVKFIRTSGNYEPLYFRQVKFDIIDEHPITDGVLKLKVMIDCEGPVKFLLFDLLGRLTYSEDAFYNTAGHYAEHTIKLSNIISSGLYMIQLHTHCGGALMEVIINK